MMVQQLHENKKIEALEELDLKYQEENRYEFDKKNHIHKLDGKPLTGISSVVKDITNFQIASYYGSRRALMDLGYDGKEDKDNVNGFKQVVSHLLDFSDEEIKEALQDAYKAPANYARERAGLGTDAHAVVEEWIKECIEKNGGYPMPSADPLIKKFIQLTRHREPRFVASEKHGFNRELWIGGITDIIVETNIGLGIWDNKNRPAIYGKDLIQMGGYTFLFPGEFTHVMGIPLEGNEVKEFRDVPQLKKVFKSQLEVYRFMQSVELQK